MILVAGCSNLSHSKKVQYKLLQLSSTALQLSVLAARLQHKFKADLYQGNSSWDLFHDACDNLGNHLQFQPQGHDGRSKGFVREVQQRQMRTEEFQQWYLASYTDCFCAELEALQQAEAPAPAAVLRQCISIQAAGYSKAYQMTALS